MNINLSIDGMHCASCVSAIEKQVRKVLGVSDVSINLVTEKAYITCDDATEVDALVSAVEKAGYSAFAEDE